MPLDASKFASVEAYSELNLEEGTELHTALMSRIDSEIQQDRITLTVDGDDNSPAGGLTNSMRAWLQGRIIPARAQAISAVEDAVGRIALGRTVNGKLLEVEKDKLKHERARKRSEVTSAYRTRNSELLSNYERLSNEHDAMYVRHGNRDAKVPKLWVELLLFFAVLIPESLINYESFLRVPLVQSGAMALGLTIVVGAFIAIAANQIGTILKQFNYYRRADDPKRQAEFWRKSILGLVLLSVALSMVGYARLYYIQPLIERALLLGQTPPELWSSIGGLLLGNFGIFLAGVIFTGWLHDADPEYSDKAREFRKAEKRKNAVQKKELDNRLDQINRRYQDDLEHADQMHQQLLAKPEYSEVAAWVSQIKSKDKQLVGLLYTYKERLTERLARERPGFTFDQHFAIGDTVVDSRKITLSDYAAMPIDLSWSQN